MDSITSQIDTNIPSLPLVYQGSATAERVLPPQAPEPWAGRHPAGGDASSLPCYCCRVRPQPDLQPHSDRRLDAQTQIKSQAEAGRQNLTREVERHNRSWAW